MANQKQPEIQLVLVVTSLAEQIKLGLAMRQRIAASLHYVHKADINVA